RATPRRPHPVRPTRSPASSRRRPADVRRAVAAAARTLVGAGAHPARARRARARGARPLGLPVGGSVRRPAGCHGDRMTRVLVVDNYDSFVYTLDGYLQQLGAETEVIRNDDVPAEAVAERIAEYDAVLLSPGPGVPAAAGVSIPAVHAAIEAGSPLLG